MQIIHGHLHQWDDRLPRISLRVSRGTLAKRRWRSAAEDGTEFGFDLEHPLEDGDAFLETEASVYLIAQQPEPVLEVQLDRTAADAARLGWMIGNLHFQLSIAGDLLRTVDDAAIRQLFGREQIAFTQCERVFQPLSGGHSHEH